MTTATNRAWLQATHLLEALATARSVQARRNALELTMNAFDCEDGEALDALVSAGAVTLVVRCLQKELISLATTTHNEPSPSSTASMEKLLVAHCQLLGLFFCCSDELAVKAFHSNGTDLVSLLVCLLLQLNEHIIMSVRSLINRIASLAISLPVTNRKGTLIRLVHQLIRDDQESKVLRIVGCQLISGWAEHPDNKLFIMQQPGLVEDVLSITLSCCCGEASGEKEIAGNLGDVTLHIASMFSHLVREARSKTELLQKKSFLTAMLVLLHKGPHYVERCSRVLDVFCQMASESSCRLVLCQYRKGSVLRALFNAMDKPELESIAIHTLLRLIGQDTMPLLMKKPTTIIRRLTACATGPSQSERDDPDSTKVLAAHSLKRLACYTSVCDKYHPDLLDALTTVANSGDRRIRMWAVKGIREQSLSSTGRFYIARSPDMLAVLVGLARNDCCRQVRFQATEALLTLASDSSNAKRMVNSSDVLETLVENADQAKSYPASGRSSIQAILALACHRTANKQRVAKTFGLVESLCSYGVSRDDDNELKKAALHCVIVLAPLM